MNKTEKEVCKAQLKDEQKALQELEKSYKKAKKDVQQKLKNLNSRTDMQNLQSIIYQQKYQKALLKQIDGVLNDLETHNYITTEQFFNGSYVNGYVGSMYELQKEGIPLTVPVDMKKQIRAIQTDSQLSSDYYMKKGLNISNIKTLKKKIASEASRGIASGKSWLEVADSLTVQKCFQVSQSDAMRIVRTEGNRINQQARLDAGDVAVQNGCDILKQWDATLDAVTRPAHREADGQIVEWNEKFIVNGEHMEAPNIGGSAGNVCNCRCQLLKRPRWALDEEELETLKKRAEFYGLDKSKSFEDYKNKFLKIPDVPVQVQTVDTFIDLSGTTTKIKKAMSQDDYDAYVKLVSENPDIASFYKYADELRTFEYENGAGCFYSSGHIEFGYPKQSYIDEGMSKYATISHEYGHYIDTFARIDNRYDSSNLTWNEIQAIKDGVGARYTSHITQHFLSNSDQFLTAVRKDFEKIRSEGGIGRWCLSDGRRHTTTGIQDAVDGWGIGRIYWGHGDKYYNRNYNQLKDWEKYTDDAPTKLLKDVYTKLGFDASNQKKVKKICRQYEATSELWANMISAETTGGKELEGIKEKFPETYKVMKEMLKGVK